MSFIVQIRNCFIFLAEKNCEQFEFYDTYRIMMGSDKLVDVLCTGADDILENTDYRLSECK